MNDQIEIDNPSKARIRFLYLLWLLFWIVWLPIGLLPPIIGLLQAHPALPRLVATLFDVILFVSIYLWATWRNIRVLAAPLSPSANTFVSAWAPIAFLTALSLLLVLMNGNGWQMMFIFIGVYSGGRLSTGQAIWTVVALALLSAFVVRLTDPSWFDLGLSLFIDCFAGFVVICVVRLARTSRELRIAREEIARLAVMAERLRIARDLHDLLGHNLSLIALKSELARRLLDGTSTRAVNEISDVEHVARATLQQVREAVAGYRQPTFSCELYAAQEILAAAGIAYFYEGEEDIIGTLPTAIETLLSWTVREGVTNTVRHSHAHQCTIHIMCKRHATCIEVIDDGIGATPQGRNTDALYYPGKGGNGLRGLAERVEEFGGEFEACSRDGSGFRLAVTVPTTPHLSITQTQHIKK